MKASGTSGLFVKQLLNESTFGQRRKLDVVWLKDGAHESLGKSLDVVRRSNVQHWGLVVSLKGFGVRVEPTQKEAAIHAMNAVAHVPVFFYNVEGIPEDATRENVRKALAQSTWNAQPTRSWKDDSRKLWIVRASTPPPTDEIEIEGVVMTFTETARPPRYIDVVSKHRASPKSNNDQKSKDANTGAESLKAVRAEMNEMKLLVHRQAADSRYVTRSDLDQVLKLQQEALEKGTAKKVQELRVELKAEISTSVRALIDTLKETQEENRSMFKKLLDRGNASIDTDLDDDSSDEGDENRNSSPRSKASAKSAPKAKNAPKRSREATPPEAESKSSVAKKQTKKK
ncbi:hypothetical protein DIPPA_03776 [Diplonema papillatum]|nr:hypothetical protein DIPPA_33693 [Diplonema papillatum]KAJ9443530.1 hypothetical protein DIPPA_21879 [Diplonema papillatum]KAJ9451880.1 hypothetical protein DIPPA_03776 [Diplonema papillatum]